jgi:hypothetical protein
LRIAFRLHFCEGVRKASLQRRPRDIVARLSREIGIALADPAVRQKLANQGVDPITMGADEFQTFVNAEFGVDGGTREGVESEAAVIGLVGWAKARPL